MKRYLAFITCFVFGLSGLFAQTRVSVQLDTTDILIGDQFQYELILELSKNSELQSIDYAAIEQAEEIELIEQSGLDTISDRGNVLLMQRLTLTSFDSGYHKIPSVPVSILENGRPKTIRTNDLAFNVSIIPIASDTVSLAPIKTIIEEPLKFQDILPYLLIGVGIIALVMVIYYYLSSRKKEVKPPPSVIVPAHQVALEKLKALQSKKLWQQGKIKQFQSELTHIVREYLENRFEIPALESTTEETLQMVKKLDLATNWHDKLRDMFQIADLVKFAKAKPPADFHDQILIEAENFVFETKKDPDSEAVEQS